MEQEDKVRLQEQIREKRRRKTIIPILGMIAVIAGVWVVFSSNKGGDENDSVDLSSKSYSAVELAAMESEDLIKIEDQTISVQGVISDIANEEDGVTIVLSADEEEMNSITCQINNSSLTAARQLQADESVKISGTLAGHTKDDILGGTSVELKDCSLK